MIIESSSFDNEDKYFPQGDETVWNQAVVDLQTRFYQLTETLEKLEENTASQHPERASLISRLTELQETVLLTMTTLRIELSDFAHNSRGSGLENVSFKFGSHTEVLLSLTRLVDSELACVASLQP
ncbi:hypothetical protein [Tellurirhabdus rosea]|uniref:hypothetical protein n=1 Tax=Tellurirhabdus rosea TaxID=2674997 RepID=UPI002259CBB1|nr:hypothetical protein [Tellurirhabdus rosea]